MVKKPDLELAERFIRHFHTRYENESILSEVCDLKVYEKDLSEISSDIGISKSSDLRSRGHAEMEYTQIGKKALFPVEAIESDIPIALINSMCRNLRLGERNYLLDELEKHADNGRISTVSFENPTHTEFQSWCNKIKKPDHLFLPLDNEFHNMVFNWRKEQDYTFNMGQVAVSGPNIVHIHWVPLDTGIEAGYLISSEGMEMVQKWFGDTAHPDEWFDYDDSYNRFSHNRPLMVYFKDQIEEDDNEDTEPKIELLYRVVLSSLFVDNDYALKLNPKKDLE